MNALSNAEVQHFLEHGYIRVPGAVPKDVCAQWEQDAFDRLGYNAQDPSTWEKDRTHMPGQKGVEVKDFSPEAYAKMCALAGGEDRLEHPARWSDAFIVNLGERATEEWRPASPKSPGWHVDGDFFLHFLDSREQALLILVLWTDVVHQGGPTYLATDSVPVISRYLADHPEGVEPNGFHFTARVAECSQFAEATGEAGDVFLVHPFTLHATSQNILRRPRIITNPTLVLKEPMKYSRPDGNYSLVEQRVLNSLGVDQLDFKPTRERERRDPKLIHAKM